MAAGEGRRTRYAAAARSATARAAAALVLLTLALAASGCGGGRAASGSSGWLSGEVRDADTGALLDATVKVDSDVYQTVGGRYKTNPVSYGVHQVSVAAAGYQPQNTAVNLNRSPYPLSFRLSREPDLVPPTVTAFYPASGASGVYRDTHLVFTFSEPMNLAATEAAVRLDPAVGFSTDWEDDSHLVVTPAGPLAESQSYTVTLQAGAADRAGNPLAGAFSSTFTTGRDLTPSSRVAFVSDTGTGVLRLHTMAPSPGSPASALFPDTVEDGEPSWSPDGKRLVFSSRRGSDPTTLNLYTARVDAPVPVPLLDSGWEDVQPKWSPDGSRIAFVSYRNLRWNAWVVGVTDQGLAVAGSEKQVTMDTGSSDLASPEWSWDGSVLVFSSTRSDGVRRLYAVDVQERGGALGEVAGRPVSSLTPDGVREDWPAWWTSADGTTHRIAYASERNDNSWPAYNWDLWVMDVTVTSDASGNRIVTASNHTRLTDTPNFNETNPVWSPDGQYLLYVRESGSNKDLYRLTVGAPELAPVLMASGAGKEISPAWSRR